jgi:hypothetical protein
MTGIGALKGIVANILMCIKKSCNWLVIFGVGYGRGARK